MIDAFWPTFSVTLFVELNLLVSLHKEVSINSNFIYYLLLSLSLLNFLKSMYNPYYMGHSTWNHTIFGQKKFMVSDFFLRQVY